MKYNKIGKDYNLTRRADKQLTENLIKYLAPTKTGTYLDIGCGTGSYTIELEKRGYAFIGIDPSERMLQAAIDRNNTIDWKIGTAENTGLSRESVDGIIASLTIHHWENLGLAFEELYAVLKPAGRIVIFTSTLKQMKGYWLNHYFPRMLKNSILQMPSLVKVQSALVKAGFSEIKTKKYFIQPNLADKFLYCGKHNPKIYLDQQIRNGISSFAAIANQMEVKKGLYELAAAIEAGEIQKIIDEYENQLGDYLYIIAKKPNC
ncbi:MAG: methyltransferase domain-containing protein [Bacteroidota bacterium]